jgi:Holliday junction resolvase
MSNPSKQKGTLFEREVAEFLQSTGHPLVERRTLSGKNDRGDLSGIPSWTFELKSTKELDLAGAVDEARVEAINAGTLWYAAIVKRRRRSIGEAYFVMPLALATRLLGAVSQNLTPAIPDHTQTP